MKKLDLTPKTPADMKLWKQCQGLGRAAKMAQELDKILPPMPNLPAANIQTDIMPIVVNSFKGMSAEEIAQHEAELAAKDKAEKDAASDKRYRNSGVPKKFFNAELSELFDAGKVCATDKSGKMLTKPQVDAFIETVANGKPQSMWFCGVAGTGKTALACAIMHELVRHEVSVKYFKSHEIMARLDDARTRASRETRSVVMTDVCTPTFRVIDEVARWPSVEWEKFTLFSVIDNCYDNFHSAIYISNMSKGDFSKYLGDAATDRFRGMSMSLDFGGKSLRGSKGELYTR